jgi:hypothetical protein
VVQVSNSIWSQQFDVTQTYQSYQLYTSCQTLEFSIQGYNPYFTQSYLYVAGQGPFPSYSVPPIAYNVLSNPEYASVVWTFEQSQLYFSFEVELSMISSFTTYPASSGTAGLVFTGQPNITIANITAPSAANIVYNLNGKLNNGPTFSLDQSNGSTAFIQAYPYYSSLSCEPNLIGAVNLTVVWGLSGQSSQSFLICFSRYCSQHNPDVRSVRF